MLKALILLLAVSIPEEGPQQTTPSKADSVEKILPSLPLRQRLDTMRWLTVQYRFTNTAKAIQIGQDKLALMRREASDYKIAGVYSELGVGHTIIGEYDKAEKYYDSSLSTAGDDRGMRAKVYTNKAIMYGFLSRFNDALDHHFKSLDIMKELGDEDGMMRAYNGIAFVYKATEDYPKAIEYYRLTREIAEKLKDAQAEATVLGNLAGTLQLAGDIKEAKALNRKAMRYAEKASPGTLILGNNYYTMANICANLEEWDSSYYYGNKAAIIFKERGQKRELGYTYAGLARSALVLGNVKEAETYGLAGYEQAKNDKVLDEMDFALFTLVKIYTYQHKIDLANKYERELQQVQDSSKRQNLAKAVVEMQTKYDTDKNIHENELLKSETALKDTELSRGRIILFSSIGGLVLLGILAISLHKSNKQRKQFNTMLQSENEQLKVEMLVAQLNQLKDQINPHFLFNSLATLQSMAQENDPSTGLFVQKLSEVYRYILQTNSDNLVSLKEELKVAEAYLFMLKARFEGALFTKIDIRPELLTMKIPPFSLQLLIENATKHNAATHTNPLHIEIVANGNEIVVRNNIQRKRSVVESTRVGLANLQKRYALLGEKSISIDHGNESFTVVLPLYS